MKFMKTIHYLLLISLISFCRPRDRSTKVTVVGSGNVGSITANYLALNEIASEIVLFNIREGKAEGKAIDIMQSANILGFSSIVTGVSKDFTLTANSDVVVITSGLPGKIGMNREDLLEGTARILKNIIDKLVKYSPNAIFIVVSNPVDVITNFILKLSGLPKSRVIGMGSFLDSNRFGYYLAKTLKVNQNDVQGLVIGGHGEKFMIPLPRYSTYKGIPVSDLLSKDKIEEVVEATKLSGYEFIKSFGTNAWVAPGAATASLVDSIINDKKRLITCSIYLEGEYGLNDITIGVPVILGKNGIEKIVILDLNEEEKAMFDAAAQSLKKKQDLLYELGLL